MARHTKKGKNRLDKYYHLAKESGYRSRAAFKLIQLNKKYGDFLSKAKVVIDLCAAPGGWLQVTERYAPPKSIIIGVDLVPIKPIPRCVTLVQDIRTDQCRSAIRQELKDWKADVILHDGAPNLGTNWVLDAYQQNLLVLHSLRLATQFLMPHGIFVTKVFRSQDYNSLLWVLQQLFETVEATKPSSSRQVSAEIFVVCRNYKSPKKIDPKLLDPKHVFKDLDEAIGETQEKQQNNATINDLLHPEKKKRNRSGYAEGDYTLYHPSSLTDFVETKDPVNVLARSTEIVLNGKKLLDLPGGDTVIKKGNDLLDKYHAHVDDNVRPMLQDLKVLGKKDFRELLRWRDQVRRTTGLEVAKKKQVVEVTPMESVNPLEEVEDLSNQAQASLKAASKLALARKKRHLLKLSRRAAFTTPADIGIEASEQAVGTFDDSTDGLFRLSDLQAHDVESSSGSSSEDSESEDSENDMADELDALYTNYLDRKRSVVTTHVEGESDAHRLSREEIGKLSKEELKKRGLDKKERYEAWYGIEDEIARLREKQDDASSDSSDDSSEDSDEMDVDSDTSIQDDEENPLSTRAQRFFDNPIFNNIPAESDSDEDIKSMNKMTRKERKRLQAQTKEQFSGNSHLQDSSFETVPVPEEDSDDDFMLDTPQAVALAQRVVNGDKSRQASKRDLIDESFHRYSNPREENLPSWFVDDEKKHRLPPQQPLTKAAVQLLKQRMRAISAAPIKKVAEAKARKRMRAIQKLKKIQDQMGKIWEDDDAGTTELAKAREMAKLQRRAMRGKALAAKKEKPKLVVAKGGARGAKGRPKGVKGRYKMVDGRLKKDVRAAKNRAKKGKGRR